jgi:hypothetical protein
MPLLTMPAPTPPQSRRMLRTRLGAAAVVAMVSVPCAVDFPAVTLHREAAYARAGDDSTAGPVAAGTEDTAGASSAGAGARADQSDGGPGGDNRGGVQNQDETQRAPDPLGRSDTILSPSQEQDLINRGWPR